jgi:putative endonuclease
VTAGRPPEACGDDKQRKQDQNMSFPKAVVGNPDMSMTRALADPIHDLDPRRKHAGMTREDKEVLRTFCVYILASKRNGTLYVGLTNDLARRAYEHTNEVHSGFTKSYHVRMLVYYEVFEDIDAAIIREKRLKKWNRQWKLRLIEEHNPKWKDLYNKDGSICELPRS